MKKTKDELNQQILLEKREQIINDFDNQDDQYDDRSSKANTKYDPKQFNIQTYSYGDYETGDMTFDNGDDVNKSKLTNHEVLRYTSI